MFFNFNKNNRLNLNKFERDNNPSEIQKEEKITENISQEDISDMFFDNTCNNDDFEDYIEDDIEEENFFKVDTKTLKFLIIFNFLASLLLFVNVAVFNNHNTFYTNLNPKYGSYKYESIKTYSDQNATTTIREVYTDNNGVRLLEVKESKYRDDIYVSVGNPGTNNIGNFEACGYTQIN